jgi:hypothetical protein
MSASARNIPELDVGREVERADMALSRRERMTTDSTSV